MRVWPHPTIYPMDLGRLRSALPHPAGAPADVVVGLADDGNAEIVARAAVLEANSRGARVRFIQLLAEGLSPEQQADADQATFRDALRALRGHGGIPCTFEVVAGDPTDALLRLAETAEVLVVGENVSGAGLVGTERCVAEATCPVLVVPVPR